MTAWLKKALKDLPTLILSVILAIAVWISAVTASDPNETRVYSQSVPIQVLGLDPGMSMTGNIPETATVTLTAPSSVWLTLLGTPNVVNVYLDLSGKEPGSYQVRLRAQVDLRPVKVESMNPAWVDIELEKTATLREVITLSTQGEPAIGYSIGTPSFSEDEVTVAGPESLVSRVSHVVAVLNIDGILQTLSSEVRLQALDVDEKIITGLSLAPQTVTVTLPVEPLSGYRNLAVKAVLSGQLAPGYRLSNITVSPQTVTVYSADTSLISGMEGFIETSAISVAAAKSDIDLGVGLKLPSGVSVVGDQTVNVHIGISPIENSVTLQNIKVQVVGLADGMIAVVSPEYISVIVSGPLYLLNQLNATQVIVSVDVTDRLAGTYQLIPTVEISIAELRIESVLPGTIEITISAKN